MPCNAYYTVGGRGVRLISPFPIPVLNEVTFSFPANKIPDHKFLLMLHSCNYCISHDHIRWVPHLNEIKCRYNCLGGEVLAVLIVGGRSLESMFARRSFWWSHDTLLILGDLFASAPRPRLLPFWTASTLGPLFPAFHSGQLNNSGI